MLAGIVTELLSDSMVEKPVSHDADSHCSLYGSFLQERSPTSLLTSLMFSQPTHRCGGRHGHPPPTNAVDVEDGLAP